MSGTKSISGIMREYQQRLSDNAPMGADAGVQVTIFFIGLFNIDVCCMVLFPRWVVETSRMETSRSDGFVTQQRLRMNEMRNLNTMY
jgi:hypothetical protein